MGADDSLVMTLVSERMQAVNTNSRPFHGSLNKVITLSQHWAIVHLRCIQHLILICRQLLELPDSFDENTESLNLRKRLSFCVRIFKLLGSLVKDNPRIDTDGSLLQATASFIDVLPSLFRTSIEFANNNAVAESSPESLAVLLLEELIEVTRIIFCKNYVFKNIQACITASILNALDSNVWRYNKSVANPKPPLAYFPRVVVCILKLTVDLNNQPYHIFNLDELKIGQTDNCAGVDFPSCKVQSEEFFLLKKYSIEELLWKVFSPSIKWLDTLMHLVVFFHYEGVKLRPILERSCSSGTKTSVTYEAENAVCHEDEALFGDLFSEGGRSVGSADGLEQSNAATSSSSSANNIPVQAATELLNFLKNCVFSPEWHPPLYEDACKILDENHVDILLSVLNCQGCYSEDKTCDNGLTPPEQRKFGHVHELCFELLHNLLSHRALSESLEESIVEKILIVENGAYMYNDQTLALLAHVLLCRSGSAGTRLRTKIYEIFVDFIHGKAKTVGSGCSGLKKLLEDLPSPFHIEILLVAFHFSSEAERAALAKTIFSSLGSIEIPSAGFDSMQLSCWALLISRLVLVLRHMIYHPRACPSSLLRDFRAKLREAEELHMPNNLSYLSSWTATMFEDVTSVSVKETPVNILFYQLIDIAPLPASICIDHPGVDCLGLTWGEICASFSWILGFWKGKKAVKAEDLITERYLFVLCWDIPVIQPSLEQWRARFSDPNVSDILNMEHFHYFSHSVLFHSATTGKYSDIPDVMLGLLQHLNDLLTSEDIRELGWDFLRCGLWLSVVLALLGTGFWEHHKMHSMPMVSSNWPVYTSGDAEFVDFSKGLVSNAFTVDQFAVVVRILSSLLKQYLGFYQGAFTSIFENGRHSTDRLSPLLLLKYAGLDKIMQDEFLEKMGINPCQLESLYELLSKSGRTVEKIAVGIRSKVFWELVLHGFPFQLQVPNEILSSCILNISGIVSVLDGVLNIKESRGINWEETDVRSILESIMTVKCDKVFENLSGKCEAIYQNLSEAFMGVDYSSLFIMKRMEEYFQSVHKEKDVDISIHECMVTKMIDVVNGLRRDPLRADVFKFFLCVDDISEKIKNLYGSQRGDILVLIDSLGYCHSEFVNMKVLDFFVDILSGDLNLDVKIKLQQKFLGMALLSLSKWLEMRLLGSVTEAPTGVQCAKGTSVSLRDSAMNFIMCLLSPSSEFPLHELHGHIFEAMLLSLDNAFTLFDFSAAKGYYNFVIQLAKGEALIKLLLQRTEMLIVKLAGDDHLLQGLKYLFGFLSTALKDCGLTQSTVELSSGKLVSSSSSALGSLTSRSLGSRKNPDALVPSANQGGSMSLDCDATSVDEDEDDGTSDGEVGSMDKEDEEDSNSERALASKVCTFTSSGSNFMEQHWYFCYTCDLTVSKGCCSVCAKVCHRGHRVVYSRSSRFFCDCGAGGVRGSSCQCLKPRKFTGAAPNRGTGNFQSFLPLADNADQLPESDTDFDEDASMDLDIATRLSIPKEVQDRMPLLLRELELEDRVLGVCSSLLPCITSRRDSNLSEDTKVSLTENKVLRYNNDLLQLKKAYKSGSLDLKIKADYSNAKELKAHLTSGSLVKSLLSVSSRGRLAVGEGDKVAIFDVGQLIGQATIAPVTADKANVKPLSKNIVRFEIVHLLFNSLVENYLVVAGYEDCQVLTLNNRGEVIDRLAVELALQGAYIRCVDWVPGSQVQLMVVTNRFVKIYDLSLDNISPIHYFTLPDDTIADATLFVGSKGRVFLIVLSELGCLYRLELSVKGNVGAQPLKESIQMDGENKHAKGSSVYYSSTHKLLFLSYQDGTTLVCRINPDATSIVEMSAVFENDPDGKLRPAGLNRWKELLGGSGLFVCYSNVKSNGVLAISVGEHEILAQNLRHAVGSTSPLVGVSAYKPLSKDKVHCLVLHDDGSLQIYSHIPAGNDTGISVMSDKVKKLRSGILKNKAYGGVKPEFPLDFFEKTVCITSDVKLSGDAIRNNDSEGAKQTLASEDGFLEGPTSAGFKVLLIFDLTYLLYLLRHL